MLKDIIRDKIYEAVWKDIPESEFDACIDSIYKRETDPYSVADEIVKRLKGA